MTEKAAFNAEEWSTVVEAPALVALRVVAADRGGTIRESLSLGRAYAEARSVGSGLFQEEVEAYRDFLLKVAETVARAHKEGGFLGIGGKEVSESEQAALDEITALVRG